MAQRGYLTNLASEFHVISVLSRLGYDACLTLGNKKRVDILVVHEDGSTKSIDVKAVAGKMDWLLGDSELHEAKKHFVVLVCYEGQFANPQYVPRIWVIPSTKLSEFVKVAGNKKTRYIPRKAFLESEQLYENAWHLLN